MISNPVATAGTALSPEWDRGFDAAFTELITSDPDLVATEFDALIGASFDEPPTPPSPPVSSSAEPGEPQPGSALGPAKRATSSGHQPDAAGPAPRPPP